MRIEFSKCMSLWTRITAKSARVSEIIMVPSNNYVLEPRKSKEHEKEATICSLGLLGAVDCLYYYQ